MNEEMTMNGDDRPGIDVTGDEDPADVTADERDEHGFGRHNIDYIRERTATIKTGHQPLGEGPAKPVEDDEAEEQQD
jgi:hypothetical protein